MATAGAAPHRHRRQRGCESRRCHRDEPLGSRCGTDHHLPGDRCPARDHRQSEPAACGFPAKHLQRRDVSTSRAARARLRDSGASEPPTWRPMLDRVANGPHRGFVRLDHRPHSGRAGPGRMRAARVRRCDGAVRGASRHREARADLGFVPAAAQRSGTARNVDRHRCLMSEIGRGVPLRPTGRRTGRRVSNDAEEELAAWGRSRRRRERTRCHVPTTWLRESVASCVEANGRSSAGGRIAPGHRW